MRSIGVIIAQTSSDMLWEILGDVLNNIPDMIVQYANGVDSLNTLLVNNNVNVLILESHLKVHNDADYQNYYELSPGLSIIVIDPVSTDTIVRLRHCGCEQLIELIRTLAADHARIEYMKITDATSSAKPWGLKSISKSSYFNSREHLAEICEWLDLTLHCYLVEAASNSSETNIPGWAMSAVQARALLGKKYSNATQQELTKACSRIKQRISMLESNQDQNYPRSKFARLTSAFQLKESEKYIIFLALAPELDDKYARIFGYLNDDLTRRRPTATTIRQLLFANSKLAWDITQILRNDSVLATYNLLVHEASEQLPESVIGLKIAPEILSYLLTEPGQPPDYGSQLELFEALGGNNKVTQAKAEQLHSRLGRWRSTNEADDQRPILQLLGKTNTLRWFQQQAQSVGDTIVLFKPELPKSVFGDFVEVNLNDQIDSAVRVAKLHDAILVVAGLDQLQKNYNTTLLIARLAQRVRRLALQCDDLLLIPGQHEIWQVQLELTDFNVRTQQWREQARLAGIDLPESEATVLASTVRFDSPEMDATLALCRAELRVETSPKIRFNLIKKAARQVSRTMVPNLVRRLDVIFGWDDIALPESTLTLLRQIPGHVHHAGIVFEDWGYRSRFPFGTGVAALFSGPSGTGKTMAAQIIANELGVELFQIDLANTVSKYIGETEKNLDNIFNVAEQASAVLLFDEADALFGKRSEVKDAHDRHANIEVAYLLQRMEAYSGMAILTTNFKNNIDSAFQRRLRFVIDFPAPSARLREAIWQRVFPAQVPFADDVDVKFLARRLELTGGHIQQIAIRAAFAAVAEGRLVHMKHIVQATREELNKLGMMSAERNLSEWAPPVLVSSESS